MSVYYIKDATTGVGGHIIYDLFKNFGHIVSETDNQYILQGDENSYIYQLFDFEPPGDIYLNCFDIFGETILYSFTNTLINNLGQNLIAECVYNGQKYKSTGDILSKPIISNFQKLDDASIGIHFYCNCDMEETIGEVDLWLYFISEDHKSILLMPYGYLTVTFNQEDSQWVCNKNYNENINGFNDWEVWGYIHIDDEGQVDDFRAGDINGSDISFTGDFISGESSVDIQNLIDNFGFGGFLPGAVIAYDSNNNIISDNETSQWIINNQTGVITAGGYVSGYSDSDVTGISYAFYCGPDSDHIIGPNDIQHLNIYIK